MRAFYRFSLIVAAGLFAACGESPVPQSAPVVVPAFVGSAACRDCHDAEYGRWQGSHHDLAMQVATEETVLGDFDDAVFEYFGETTRFYRDGDDYVVKTRGADGAEDVFRVAYAFGVEPLQQYLMEFPNGRLQTLPFTWDSRREADGGQRWYHVYGDDYIGADDPLYWTGRLQNWNYMCAECHSTDLDVGYDLASDAFNTTWSEIDVSCEACHGPGAVHIAQAATGDFGTGGGFDVDLDDHGRAVWQMNPETGMAERSELAMRPPQQPESCGRCHARRGVITSQYEYGKPLADTHRTSLLDDPLYFADGQILDEVYVYGSFLQSKMYAAGVTCSDCHDPHSLLLKAGDEPSQVCGQCHLATRFESGDHHRHTVGQVACVDCHMTSRVYMGVDARRDHSFRVPRPDLTVTTGSPNACNTCHEDQDADWALAAYRDWWGSARENTPHFATALHAGRQGHANADLRGVITDSSMPGIARATALTLLRSPLAEADLAAIRASLADADPLVRIAALQAVQGWPQDWLAQLVPPLLTDPVRGVRIDAATVLAGMRELLSGQARLALDAAAREYVAAQLAVASRPEAHANLGNFAIAGGQLDKALEHYEQALAMEPEYTVARLNMADALRRAGDEERGEAVIREGLQRDSDSAALRHSLGLLLVRKGRAEEGVAELRAAADLDPGNSRYVYVLGVALNSTGEANAAIERLRDARTSFPGEFDIGWALATILRDEGRVDEALDVVTDLAARFPENRDVAALRSRLETAQ
jgi:tetratricopeptide (TPR) repeat protein